MINASNPEIQFASFILGPNFFNAHNDRTPKRLGYRSRMAQNSHLRLSLSPKYIHPKLTPQGNAVQINILGGGGALKINKATKRNIPLED